MLLILIEALKAFKLTWASSDTFSFAEEIILISVTTSIGEL